MMDLSLARQSSAVKRMQAEVNQVPPLADQALLTYFLKVWELTNGMTNLPPCVTFATNSTKKSSQTRNAGKSVARSQPSRSLVQSQKSMMASPLILGIHLRPMN